MKPADAVKRLTDVIRRKQFAPGAERSYRGWPRPYCGYIKRLQVHLSSEQILERFLTALAKMVSRQHPKSSL
jgi:hypothetical protein